MRVNDSGMLRPPQIRAARALLGMSQQELALRSEVGLATLKRIEAAGLELTGTARTLFRIQKALEAAGVVIIEQTKAEGPGVRLASPVE
ncbi:MAG: helix-turn-helix transcriptional regulator [Hyphomicrobiaceae bacterium]|nr:helix-turn-helix transcriptional regulator [Hyphomicrobiaceae bacterium]